MNRDFFCCSVFICIFGCGRFHWQYRGSSPRGAGPFVADSSCGPRPQQLQRGLSLGVACRAFRPSPGVELWSCELQDGFLTLGAAWRSCKETVLDGCF